MSATVPQAGLETYFEEARRWDEDRIQQASSRARLAWRVAVGALVCTLMSGAALVLLIPLKSVEPYLIRVDNSTGVVDVVPIYKGSAPLDETVTRYFLSHYVSVCERFNFATAESDYEECGAYHGAQRNQAWYALWNRNNPHSPLNVHRDGSTIAVEVSAISFFQRASGATDTAQVRYVKNERASAGAAERGSHWIATIQYAFTAPSSDPKVRRWNPLGFRVIEFVTEPEAATELGAERR
jgi:type IV secretion system protein VirB8